MPFDSKLTFLDPVDLEALATAAAASVDCKVFPNKRFAFSSFSNSSLRAERILKGRLVSKGVRNCDGMLNKEPAFEFLNKLDVKVLELIEFAVEVDGKFLEVVDAWFECGGGC